MTNSFKTYLLFIFLFSFINSTQAEEVKITLSQEKASIENEFTSIIFDLENGKFQGTDKTSNTTVFKDAWFRLDPGEKAWRTPPHLYKAENLGAIEDALGKGNKLRVWYLPEMGYDPQRFLDITVYENKRFVVFNWGVKNNFEYTVRVRKAEILNEGVLFNGKTPVNPKVLRSGAGASSNFVENSWTIDALNGGMLTYIEGENKRRTIVGGGLKYNEFGKSFETHKGRKEIKNDGTSKYKGEEPFLTLTVWDPQGKRIAPGETWISDDNYYLDFVTKNPFESLEKYGNYLALANNANPNPFDFPTLCGWMVSTKNLGEGKSINHSPGLVEQMDIAKQSGITKYTPVAVRLEPDYYCYSRQGDTQQGWWDDEHWARYGSLKKPYETFGKFSKAVNEQGGKIFTYYQASMPSNDFAVQHADWMLNDDISLLHVDHHHHRPILRYDYTNSEFQDYMLKMWQRVGNDGVEGIKFDYPETGWARDGGFDDKNYTTTSAYRKIFQLCRDGLGKDAYIHERALGESNTPILDCSIGIVDMQRVWWDASHFEPEMASRVGLRWFKQGKAFRYYPDGKSFYYKGVELSKTERRSFLTLVGLLSGRLELGTSFGSMTDEMMYDLSRIYPVLPNGQSFRPVDMFLDKKHPETYVYDVNENWKQVILTNNSLDEAKKIEVQLSGNQVTTGALELNENSEYYVFDFWNQKPLGKFKGDDVFSAELKAKESNVYAIQKVSNHPQIIGTNRHIMCGMVELHNTEWDSSKKSLSVKADLIEGKTMDIFVAVPKTFKISKATASDSKVKISESENGFILSISGKKKENFRSDIDIQF